MTIMIALIGEQQLPNYLPALYYHPNIVLAVHTEKTESQYRNLQTVLKQKKFEQKKIAVEGVKTDPYDLALIVQAINEKLDTITGASAQSLIFNLTGATKIMSLAAYQVAVQRSAPIVYLQSEKGQSLLDYYSWQDNQLHHHKPAKELPEYLTLQDMLDLHLGQGLDKWHIRPKNQKDPGVLFELAIGQALQKYGYEVLCGVTDNKNQIDIDVMMRCKNHIVLIEAKTKTSKKSRDRTFDGFQQLSTNTRYLGGTYTYPLLVTNYNLTNEQQQTRELMRIYSISLLHYQQQMVTLPQADIDTLLTTIQQTLNLDNR
jgi:hypothetical protein